MGGLKSASLSKAAGRTCAKLGIERSAATWSRRSPLPQPDDHVRSYSLLPGNRAAVGTDSGAYVIDSQHGRIAARTERPRRRSLGPGARRPISATCSRPTTTRSPSLESRHRRAAGFAVRRRRRMDRLDAARLLRGFAGRRKPDGLAHQPGARRRWRLFIRPRNSTNRSIVPTSFAACSTAGNVYESLALADRRASNAKPKTGRRRRAAAASHDHRPGRVAGRIAASPADRAGHAPSRSTKTRSRRCG